MPVSGEEYPFTKKNVDGSPDKPGVYVLLKNGGVSYYGMSTTSIRSRLQRHQSGAEGACTKAATHYKREITSAKDAPVREAQLLAAYKNRYGKLPQCNERAS